MIPQDRPVRGTDFISVERQLGLRTPDMLFLLGMMAPSYYSLKRQNTAPRAGVKQPSAPSITQAVLLRLITEEPDLVPLPRAPSASELFALCKSIDKDFTARHLALLLGRDGTAGYKWLHRQGISPMRLEVERLMLVIWLKLQATPVPQRKRVLSMLMDLVMLEAQLRGYDHGALRTLFRFQPARISDTSSTSSSTKKGKSRTKKAPSKPKAGTTPGSD